jgi:hypothetical protein
VSGTEVVEDAVSVGLVHSGVDVITSIAQVSNLLREQLHPLRRITEDYRLRDLQLRE